MIPRDGDDNAMDAHSIIHPSLRRAVGSDPITKDIELGEEKRSSTSIVRLVRPLGRTKKIISNNG